MKKFGALKWITLCVFAHCVKRRSGLTQLGLGGKSPRPCSVTSTYDLSISSNSLKIWGARMYMINFKTGITFLENVLLFGT